MLPVLDPSTEVALDLGLAMRSNPCLDSGEVAEWSNAHAWKACGQVSVPRVRIPVSPPHIPIK